jgi:hypothetical protein
LCTNILAAENVTVLLQAFRLTRLSLVAVGAPVARLMKQLAATADTTVLTALTEISAAEMMSVE